MLTTKEAGDKLNVCDEAVRTYIRKGDLKAIKIYRGKKLEYRIKLSDLEEFKKEYLNYE